TRGTRAASPMYVYRWDMMREILEKHKDWDGDPYEALMVEYIDPTTGAPVFKTITFFVQMLRPCEKTQPLRQTASLLVAPFEGAGHSIVDGKTHTWNAFDTMAVPGGSWCQHVNASETEPAILFVASDEPALKAFNLFKRWGKDASGDTVILSDR
ncbi:MAG: gentisate 1,2-dioxygenase, partial [Pseudomonadota bacterium]